MDAICLANASVTALFFAAAPGEAGSWYVVSVGGAMILGRSIYLMLGDGRDLRVGSFNRCTCYAR